MVFRNYRSKDINLHKAKVSIISVTYIYIMINTLLLAVSKHASTFVHTELVLRSTENHCSVKMYANLIKDVHYLHIHIMYTVATSVVI
jgi:hypothetical protein